MNAVHSTTIDIWGWFILVVNHSMAMTQMSCDPKSIIPVDYHYKTTSVKTAACSP